MRSGQYKLAGAGSRGAESQVTVVGHFRSSQSDLPPPESLVGDFPHMNSLVVTKNKLSDSRPFNKSCENLSTSGGGARSAVTRVEQRVKSLLQRGESRLRHSNNGAPVEDVWQYGHIVTLPRRPRLSLALSHSALHHLSSDTASCLSGSSGYSSSSSSSYGSFKSSTSSSCSTLPRKKSRSEGSALPSEGDMPPPLTRSCTLVDNPMYDVMPATNSRNFSHNKSPKRRGSPPPRNEPFYDLTPDSDPYNLDNCETRQGSPSTHDPIYDVIPGGDPRSTCRESLVQCHNQLYDLTRPSRLLTPDSGTHGGLDSLEESALDSLDCSDPQNGMLEDEFFEEEDQVAKECREYFERRLKNSETLKKRWSMCSSDSGADPGDSDVSATSLPTSGDPLSIASNTSSTSDDPKTSHSSSATQVTASPKKTPLDQKMEFLRKEIASLMNQDNALFRQLLTLHDSISALKTSPAHAYRPPSPASLDSFTEDDDDDDEEDEDDDQVVVGRTQQKTGGRDDNLSDVDEGLEMDHSTSHSTSPTSTLSSNSSRDSQFSRYSKAAHTSPDSSPTQPSRPTNHNFQRATNSPHLVQNGQLHQTGPANLAFMRCRKSYAPNARNRRRSSSAHLLGRPDSETLSGYCERPDGTHTATLSRTSTHKSTSMRLFEGIVSQGDASPSNDRWGPDAPTGRPRSSSAVVTAAEYCNKAPTTAAAAAAAAGRPLVRTPYREALIM